MILPSGDPPRRGDEPVALVALADREWVLFEREHALGQLVEALRGGGFTPRAAVRSAQIAGVAALAAAALGPALVPSNIVSAPVRNAVRNLASRRARELCAFTRSGWSPWRGPSSISSPNSHGGSVSRAWSPSLD